jgi:hypothetical protein
MRRKAKVALRAYPNDCSPGGDERSMHLSASAHADTQQQNDARIPGLGRTLGGTRTLAAQAGEHAVVWRWAPARSGPPLRRRHLLCAADRGQWAALNQTDLCAKSTAHVRFHAWVQEGVFGRLWQAGGACFEELVGIDWAWLSLDGALTKAPLGGKDGLDSDRPGQAGCQAQPAARGARRPPGPGGGRGQPPRYEPGAGHPGGAGGRPSPADRSPAAGAGAAEAQRQSWPGAFPRTVAPGGAGRVGGRRSPTAAAVSHAGTATAHCGTGATRARLVWRASGARPSSWGVRMRPSAGTARQPVASMRPT